MQPVDVLKKYFGYTSFRGEQEAIIQHTLAGKDSLVLMPTGGGKSVCFQIPALMMSGVTVVISPLIALMKDQVDGLKENGVSVAFLNSSMLESEKREVVNQLRRNELKLVYLAPERLMSNTKSFLDFLKEINVSLFAIDEAHCISQWGHDFRPDYLMLTELKKNFPETPVIALTASADEITRKDIADKLELHEPKLFISSFNRPNIFYFVERKKNSFDSIINYLHEHKDDSGIIYALSRNSCESLASKLRDEGFSAKHYHAGLEPKERSQVQDEFVRDEIRIIVATIAFGLGIDKSNVRFVIHYDVPKNIEGYYQETGRAGRDGLRSDAILFYSYGDIIKLKKFAEVENNEQQTDVMLRKLDEMRKFCETNACRRKMLLNYFNESFGTHCESCDYCLSSAQKFDATIIAQKALSAVARTGEKYGIKFIVDFLRGAENEKIKEHHRQLKTFGVGKDISARDWMTYMRELIGQDFLHLDSSSGYPVVKLAAQSQRVLRGEEKVFLTPLVPQLSKELTGEAPVEYEKELFDRMRIERLRLAREMDLPPYVILSDATLIELATFLPLTKEEIRKISGFGDLKTERYGETFLTIIKNYAGEKNLSSRIQQKKPKRDRKTTNGEQRPSKVDTRKISFDLYKSGKSIADVAEQRQLSADTIMGHLATFIPAGEITIEELVPEGRVKTIVEAIQKVGTQWIGEIKRALPEDFRYGEINAVIAQYESVKQ